MLLDYSRAFDTVSHDVLRAILRYIGLSEMALNIIAAFLMGRSQTVVLNGKQSSFLSMLTGVPQGSVLSPLLFTVYISRFPTAFLSCTQHYYADDVQLCFSFFLEECMQAISALNYDLSNLKHISINHSLKLNPQKTNAIIFGKRKDKDVFMQRYSQLLKMDNCNINFQQVVKSLGLFIDSDLRFSHHVTHILKKSYTSLKLIFHNRHFLDVGTKALLCDSLVLSHPNYCDTVYGPCITNMDSNRLQKLQNSCLRLIYGIRKFDRISHKLKEISWLSMVGRRRLHSAC